MLQTYLSRIVWLVVLLLLQILVFNHVHIFGYATPMPYIYLLLILPLSTPRWVYVTVGFALGLCIDLFTNTPGVAAGATCLAGLLAPLLLRAFAPADTDDEAFEPSIKTMETGGFMKFAFTLILIHSIAFFTFEAFSFQNWQALLINIGGSTLLSTLLCAAMELIRSK